MSAKVAINGCGRIGRNVLRAAQGASALGFEIVAVNDLTDAATLAHLLKYDSLRGPLAAEIGVAGDSLVIDGRPIRVCREPDPARLPWEALGAELVIEASGRFTARQDAARHLAAGAQRVLISAPGEAADLTVCLGVNQQDYDPSRHRIVSNASCTTNCLAPVARVILEKFGIVKGLMNTVHPYTNDQTLHDAPHQDLRRGRAAGPSMIPTTNGAVKALFGVLPELEGKLEGMAVRVPTAAVALIDLVVETARPTTATAVNAALKGAADGPLKGILDYCELPLVSMDFRGSPASATVDAGLTSVVGGNLLRVIAWYDNEWGYANRIVELAGLMTTG